MSFARGRGPMALRRRLDSRLRGNDGGGERLWERGRLARRVALARAAMRNLPP